MADTTYLDLNLRTQPANAAIEALRRNFRSLTDTIRDVERNAGSSSSKIGSSFGGLKATIAGVGTALAGLGAGKYLFDTIREFETLRTTLNTVTGGVAQGTATFNALKDVAQKTPNSLKDMVDAFNVLSARGIKPSSKDLISFANTASATGKGIKQFSEAIADAQTGEFERLKEFGIIVKKNGDQLAVTVAGQTENIKNSSDAIVAKLVEVGNTTYGDAAAGQMKTIAGQLNNLGDQIATTAYNIGEGGLKQAISDVIGQLAGTVTISEDAAKAIGKTLGDAVNFTADAVKSFIGVLNDLAPIIAGIGAGAAVFGIQAIANAIKGATIATVEWTAALLANPVGLVAAAVGALVAALGFLIKDTAAAEGVNVSWFNILQATWNVISKALIPVIDVLKKTISDLGPILQTVGKFFYDLANIAIGTAKTIVDVNIAAVKLIFDAFKSLAGSVGNVFKAFAQAATGDFKGAGSSLSAAFNNGFATGIKNNVGNLTKQIQGNFTTDYVKVGVNAARGLVRSVTDEAKRLATTQKGATAATSELAGATSGATNATNANAAAVKAHEQAVKSYVDSLKSQQTDLQLQLDTYGKTESQILAVKLAREAESLGITTNTQAIRDNIVALQQQLAEKRLQTTLADGIADTEFETKALSMNTKERAIATKLRAAENAAKSAGRDLTQQEIDDITRTTAALEDTRKAIDDRKKAEEDAKKAAEDAEKKRQEALKETIELYKRSYEQLGDSLAEMVEENDFSLRKLAATAIRIFAQLYAQKMAMSAATGGGSSLASGFISGFAGAFGGTRALGGPVVAGQSYWVGEDGPELVTPTQNGYVNPAAGGNVYHINFNGAIGDNVNVVALKDELIEALKQSEARTRKNLYNEHRYGGALNG